ncbi:MAG: beta-propeller fold lactonase family protein [Armatimonadetes bacterium]|nr:beta-propeller fold lactonase family protein [Armatimonadota bacterium]
MSGKHVFLTSFLVATVIFAGCYGKPKGGTVGLVTDPRGTLVEGAHVAISGTGDTGKKSAETTDSTGSFSFILGPGSYIINVTKEGYQPQSKTVNIGDMENKSIIFTLVPVGGSPQGPYGSAFVPGGTLSPAPINTATARVYVAHAGTSQVLNQGQNPQSGFLTPNSPSTMGDMAIMALHTDFTQTWGWQPGTNPTQGMQNMPNAYGQMPGQPGQMPGQMPGMAPYPGMPQYPQSQMPGGFMPGPGSKALMLLDTHSNLSVGFLSMETQPLWLCMHPSGSRLYVADDAKRVAIHDVVNNNVFSGAIMVGDYLIKDMIITSSGNRLYLALQSGTPALGIIDTTTDSLNRVIPMPKLRTGNVANVGGVASNHDGSQVYVSMGDSNYGEVALVNGFSGQVAGTYLVQAMPMGLAVTPDGRKLFVANFNSASVTVIDTASRTIVETIRVGLSPSRIAIRPNGATAYVTNRNSNSISVIDVNSNRRIGDIPVGQGPVGIAVTPDGNRVYVANNAGGNVTIIDANGNNVISQTTQIPGSRPFGIAIKP